MSGWVKLHRKVLDNEIFRHDRTAWHVFETLLILADSNNGKWSGGMFQLSHFCNIERGTLYKAVQRLEKAGMVNRSVNTKYTVYNILKWQEYQGNGKQLVNSQYTHGKQLVNAGETAGNTLTRNRSKNIELESNKVELQEQVRQAYDFYVEKFVKDTSKYKLTDKRKAKIRARVKDAGLDMLKKAIDNTSTSNFHRGDNERGWEADLDFIVRSYEQVEKLATMKERQLEYKAEW